MDTVISRRNVLAYGGATTVLALAGCSGGANEPPDQVTSKISASHPREPHTVPGAIVLDLNSGSIPGEFVTHGGASIGPSYGKSGRNGCRLRPRAGNDNLAALTLDAGAISAGRPWATFSMTFRLVTAPKLSDSYMNLFEIGNTGKVRPKSQFTAYFRNGRLVCDFNSSERLDIAPTPRSGEWHSIRAIVDYGASTYHATIKFDDERVASLTSRNDKHPEAVRALWVHYPTVPVDYTMDISDLRIAVSKRRPHFFRLAK